MREASQHPTAPVSAEQMHELPPTPFWSTLYAFARPHRRQLLRAMLCALVVSIAVPLPLQFTVKWIIDSALEVMGVDEAERLHRALGFVLLFAGLSVFRITVWVVGYRGMLASIEGILFRIRAGFFRHVQRMCFRFHDQVSSGELFNYIMGSPLSSLNAVSPTVRVSRWSARRDPVNRRLSRHTTCRPRVCLRPGPYRAERVLRWAGVHAGPVRRSAGRRG